MKKNLNVGAALLLSASIALFACSKENSGDGTSTLHVRLTDAPAVYDSVNIDIREVRVNLSEDTSANNTGWVNMTTNAGRYNLLSLQNGVDTLLATTTLPSQTVKQIRLILGTDSYVVVGGIKFPLITPSGAESGLKIKLNKKLDATLESVLIDFDAALSIHETGNGSYILRPVLKIK